jgi:predicted nucleotide-binding protein (sugar kinase/HSP70/actin superfamily)
MVVDDTYHLPGCPLFHGEECVKFSSPQLRTSVPHVDSAMTLKGKEHEQRQDVTECDCNKQDVEKTFEEAYAEMEARYERDLRAHDAAVERRQKEQQQNFWLGVTLWGLLAVGSLAAIIAAVSLGQGAAEGNICLSSLAMRLLG